MPSCFALYDKTTGERAILQEVDKAICKHLDMPVNEETWAYNWYNTIGLSLAIGHDWDAIRKYFPELTKVIDFLDANYTPDAWKEFR